MEGKRVFFVAHIYIYVCTKKYMYIGKKIHLYHTCMYIFSVFRNVWLNNAIGGENS